MDTDAANLFFQLIASRYQQGSVMVTSNLPYGRWGGWCRWCRLAGLLLGVLGQVGDADDRRRCGGRALHPGERVSGRPVPGH